MVQSTHVLRTTGEDPVARALLAQITAEWTPVYGPPFPGDPASIVPADLPHYVALVEGERPLAGGGLRALGDGIAEVKRMYVVPEARSRGHARRLLAAIEDAARELGYERVRLDTGASQPHARALYESAGYRTVPDYNDSPYAAYHGEKVL